MNTLSWLIYLADTLPSLSTVFGITAVVIGGGLIFLAIDGMVNRDVYDEDHPEHINGVRKHKLVLKVMPLVLLFSILSVLIPSKNTILLVAASEAGEAVIKTPEAQEVFTDLRAVLKSQLEALKKQ